MAVNTDGRQAIVGLHIGPSEAETLVGPPEQPTRRGLPWVKQLISVRTKG